MLLYFHGGGYIGAATPAHWKFQFALQRALAAEKRLDLAILSLSYSLAPSAAYPTQLRQAAAALRYLLETEARDPETVLLGGDSAGGNLACALMLHLARPHAEVARLELGEGRRLRGAMLISPWVDFGTVAGSFERNETRDYITVKALKHATSMFVGMGGKLDVYCHPSEADEEAWKDVAAKVGEILVWGGGGEVLIDGIRTFAGVVRRGFEMADELILDKELEGSAQSGDAKIEQDKRRVKFVETPEMAHEEMIIDRVLRIKEKGLGEIALENWISSVL